MEAQTDFEKRIYQFYRSLYVKMESTISAALANEGITAIQLRILSELDLTEGLPVGELGVRLGMNTGNCSSACKRMESRGLLLRTRAQEDERVVRVAIAPKGKAALKRIYRLLSERQEAVLSRMTPEEQRAMSESMDRLEAYFQQLS